MANHKSALKRIRANATKRLRNRYQAKTTRTFIKRLRAAEDKKTGLELLPKLWAAEDRPREKLLLQGRRFLTDAELLAVLIASGNKEETAVDLAKRILDFFKNDLDALGKAGVAELSGFKGIGQAKAITIMAVLELGRRRKESPQPKVYKIKTARDVIGTLRPLLSDLDQEELWLLVLNGASHLKAKHLVSKGGQSDVTVDVRVIFRVALEHRAAKLILAHNHPSGEVTPSPSDKALTKKVVELGKMLNIPLLDHIIVTDRSFFSFADGGLI
eukprot:gene3083-3533_t